MKFLKRLLRRKNNDTKNRKKDSFDLTFGDIRIKALKSSDTYALVQLQGIGRNHGDAIIADTLEKGFIEAHPCKCGGKWEIKSRGSAYPMACKDCGCDQCGATKKFEFKFG